MAYECDFMTPEGCPSRNTAKQLQMQAILEGDSTEMMQLCTEKCCFDCKIANKCAFRCGKSISEELSHKDELKNR